MVPVPGARVPTGGNLSFMVYRGRRRDGSPHYHRGIDLPAPFGSPVVAAAGGTVVQTVDAYRPGYRGYGKVVVIRSPGGLFFLYAHLDRIDVAAGAVVKAGEPIGTVGKTAYTREEPAGELKRSGPHLHFEVSDSAYPKPAEARRLDPVAMLRRLAGGRPTPTRAPTRATGGGAGLALAAVALVWAFSSK